MPDKIKSSCFLIRVQDQNNQTIDRGTGFFINDEGNFLSAGHVFKRQDCTYLAEIESNVYPITTIFHEYVDQDHYTDRIYHDLVIGMVNFKSEHFLSLANEKPTISTSLNLSGFNRPDAKSKEADISIFNTYNSKVDVAGVVKVNREIDDFFQITNVIKIVEVPLYVAGLSGGPITIGNVCYGTLCTISECLQSRYIIEKLKEFKIPFTQSETSLNTDHNDQ
ncbi:hypothetical protein HDF26_004025 [Pedobacter cryoconitis]|uniref:hypothetical protein n=1 Tax=Pedobacter cryoconitis TaxID=188932 RepID=UPI00160781D0|nr:hypothetical protein [Pedobacter cryoconitis]MBB6273565.1 hypothetical protein [Pedobacter cryoconitis]